MKLILKILTAPLTLLISFSIRLCAGLISCSAIVFKIASALLTLAAFTVLFLFSVRNGIILLALAFLVSPMGLPLLAVKALSALQRVNGKLKRFIHN